MKHFNTNHRTTLFLLMVLFTNLSSYAQKMVGDGFGGRPGYDPVNLYISTRASGIICSDKSFYVWGILDSHLNNGGSTSVQSTTPMLSSISNVRQVANSNGGLGSYIKDDGTGYIFSQPTPYTNSLISNAYHTDASNGIAFVKTDGTVWYGGGSMVSGVAAACPCTNNQPATYCVTQVPGLSNIKRVAMASNSANIVALAADGTVKTIYGGMGNYPASLKSNTAITIPGLSNIVDVKASHGNYYALTSSGQVYAWGVALGMGTGLPLSSTQYEPQLVTFPAGAAPIKAIAPAKFGQNCLALDDNGVCYVWGTKFMDNGTTYYATPQVIATNVRDMVAAADYSYYYKNDGTLWGLGRKDWNMFNLSTPTTPGYFNTLTQLTIPSTMCAIQSFTGMPPCTVNNITPIINKN